MSDMLTFIEKTLSEVEDEKLVSAILDAFTDQAHLFAEVQAFYEELTDGHWTSDSLRSFFHGWRSPNGASDAVASLGIRLSQLGVAESQPEARDNYFRAAAACGEIIEDDVGLGRMQGREHHARLYERLASAVCGDDAWKLDEALVPETKNFSSWVGKKRPLAEDLGEGLEMMMMTEIFNTGEYNFMYPLFRPWLKDTLGFSEEAARRDTLFLFVHTGEVEADHFKHSVDAIHRYHDARGESPNYERIQQLAHEYVERARQHFRELRSVLEETAA